MSTTSNRTEPASRNTTPFLLLGRILLVLSYPNPNSASFFETQPTRLAGADSCSLQSHGPQPPSNFDGRVSRMRNYRLNRTSTADPSPVLQAACSCSRTKLLGNMDHLEKQTKNIAVAVGPLVPVTPLIGQLTIFRIIKSIKKIVVFSQTMMVFKDCVK